MVFWGIPGLLYLSHLFASLHIFVIHHLSCVIFNYLYLSISLRISLFLSISLPLSLSLALSLSLCAPISDFTVAFSGSATRSCRSAQNHHQVPQHPHKEQSKQHAIKKKDRECIPGKPGRDVESLSNGTKGPSDSSPIPHCSYPFHSSGDQTKAKTMPKENRKPMGVWFDTVHPYEPAS